MSFLSLPVSSVAGRRIGLFGGSFNPAHAGHLAVSAEAIKRLDLDQVWWMVSPQNPLKDSSETADFEERVQFARSLVTDPRVLVTEIEGGLGSTTTAQTFSRLEPLFRRGRFVWIMGADSFAGLNKWHDWRQIPATLPLAVFARPGWSRAALSSPAARWLSRFRLDSSDAALLPEVGAPAWCFINMPLSEHSSTHLRQSAKTGL